MATGKSAVPGVKVSLSLTPFALKVLEQVPWCSLRAYFVSFSVKMTLIWDLTLYDWNLARCDLDPTRFRVLQDSEAYCYLPLLEEVFCDFARRFRT